MSGKPASVTVLREFPYIGKYRLRLIERKGKRCLDIREYVSSNEFEGFTRRGIALASSAEVNQLRKILDLLVKEKYLT